MEKQEISEQQDVGIASYTPTAYEEVSWPVVESGEPPVESSFQQTTFETISQETNFAVDPMFPDFTDEFLSQAQEKEVQQYCEPSSVATDRQEKTFEGSSPTTPSDEQSNADFVEDTSGISGSIEEPEASMDRSAELEADDNHASESFLAQQVPELELEPEVSPEAVQTEQSGIDEAALMQALEESYAKGCSDTRAEVELSKRQIEESYTLLWEDMQTQLAESLHNNERRAVELAFQIAKRMVGNVVETQREYVVNVIREALQAAGGAEIKSIRVSPQDYEFLSLNGYGERVKIHGDAKLSFTSDETIRAGCVVETSSGQVDFDLDKAWSRMHGKVFQGPQS
jgi:flagellar assembly protein FliH